MIDHLGTVDVETAYGPVPEHVCSICQEEIGKKDNRVNFGCEEFKRWRILEEVCAQCVIEVFRELDKVPS